MQADAEVFESDIDSVSMPDDIYEDISGYEDADGFDDEPLATCLQGHETNPRYCPICKVDNAVGLQTTDTIPNKLNVYNYTCQRGHHNLFGVRGADCRACRYEDQCKGGRAWAVRESDPIRYACVCGVVQYVVEGSACERGRHLLPQNIPYGVMNIRAYVRSILEFLFHQRFDSVAPIPLTAYCSTLKIAVTCAMDIESMSAYPSKWSRENNCKHVHLMGATTRLMLMNEIANAFGFETDNLASDYYHRAGICAHVDSTPPLTAPAHVTDRQPSIVKDVRRCREFNANGELRTLEKSKKSATLSKYVVTCGTNTESTKSTQSYASL